MCVGRLLLFLRQIMKCWLVYFLIVFKRVSVLRACFWEFSITALHRITNDFEKAINETGKILKIKESNSGNFGKC